MTKWGKLCIDKIHFFNQYTDFYFNISTDNHTENLFEPYSKKLFFKAFIGKIEKSEH